MKKWQPKLAGFNSHVERPSCSVERKRELQHPQKQQLVYLCFIKSYKDRACQGGGLFRKLAKKLSCHLCWQLKSVEAASFELELYS